MQAVRKFLIGGAAIAATTVGFAAPAAAQYYPGGGYGGGNVLLGAILDSILRGGAGGYGNRYGYGYANERIAIDQCARAAEARLNGRYGGYGNYGYGGYGGYSQPYGYGYNNAGIRVNQIERVERTRNGNFRVVGWAGQAGWRGNYGGYGGYNAPYGGYGYNQAAAPTFRFSCKFDRRYGRITDLDIDRQRYARYGYGY